MTTPTGVVSDIPHLPLSVRRPTVLVERPGGRGGRERPGIQNMQHVCLEHIWR